MEDVEWEIDEPEQIDLEIDLVLLIVIDDYRVHSIISFEKNCSIIVPWYITMEI